MGGLGAAWSAFGVAALAIVVLVFGLSLSIATAQERVVAALRGRAPEVKRWGGGILVLVGLWLFALTVFADFFARVFPV